MAKFKVTYATQAADSDELHAEYDKGLERVRGEFGQVDLTIVCPTDYVPAIRSLLDRFNRSAARKGDRPLFVAQ